MKEIKIKENSELVKNISASLACEGLSSKAISKIEEIANLDIGKNVYVKKDCDKICIEVHMKEYHSKRAVKRYLKHNGFYTKGKDEEGRARAYSENSPKPNYYDKSAREKITVSFCNFKR
jgi:hypothetical protein